MPLRNRDLEATLQSKFGFISVPKSSGHRHYVLKLDGLPPIWTMVSHGKQDISSKLEAAIAKQLRVRVAFFREMISCTKSREEYYRQVRTDPFPPWDFRR